MRSEMLVCCSREVDGSIFKAPRSRAEGLKDRRGETFRR